MADFYFCRWPKTFSSPLTILFCWCLSFPSAKQRGYNYALTMLGQLTINEDNLLEDTAEHNLEDQIKYKKEKETKIIELLFLPITARAIIQERFRHVFILHLNRVPGKQISSTCSGSRTDVFWEADSSWKWSPIYTVKEGKSDFNGGWHWRVEFLLT